MSGVRVDLERIGRDLAAWTAQGDTGPLTKSPGFRALLRTACALLTEVRRLRTIEAAHAKACDLKRAYRVRPVRTHGTPTMADVQADHDAFMAWQEADADVRRLLEAPR